MGDVNGDGLPDIVVSDQASGDVTVLLNDPAHSFSQSLRFRASTGLLRPDTTSGESGRQLVRAVGQPGRGRLHRDGRDDVVVVNQATHSFTVLVADGNGGFANPRSRLTTSTSDGLSINERPGAIVAGDFNRDGKLDLAVLMEDTGQIWIYSGNGNGTFRAHVQHPGRRRGHRAIRGPRQRQRSAQSAGGQRLRRRADPGGQGRRDLPDPGQSRFAVRRAQPAGARCRPACWSVTSRTTASRSRPRRATVTQYAPVQTLGMPSSSSAQLAPGDVQWAFLDKGQTLPDAVVVSTGSNAVVVYRTTVDRGWRTHLRPAPQTYFVGTAPASVTVADINGDGIPDMLIANQGSNDVSVIFGSYDASGDWVGIPGPRLKSGGDGPIAVIVRDLNGNSIPDLAVVNGGSGTVTLLPGVGRGFFDDQVRRRSSTSAVRWSSRQPLRATAVWASP